MGIKQPVCLKCKIEMIVIANDIPFIVNPIEEDEHYHVEDIKAYNGDIWQCNKCRGIIATGFGNVQNRLPERLLKWTKENPRKYIMFNDLLGGTLQTANENVPGVVCCKCKIEMTSESKIDIVHMEENRDDNKRVLDATASGWKYICTECGASIAVPTGEMKTGWALRVSNEKQTKEWLFNRNYTTFTRTIFKIVPEGIDNNSVESILGSGLNNAVRNI